MKIKTNELSGAALDWAVAAADGRKVLSILCGEVTVADRNDRLPWRFNPSESWSQGGPIIEREGIGTYRECLRAYPDYRPVQGKTWEAIIGLYLVGEHEAQGAHGLTAQGATALEAAMRVFVLSKLGDEVDVPEED